MSNILLGSIDDNKNFIVENNEIVKDDKYLLNSARTLATSVVR